MIFAIARLCSVSGPSSPRISATDGNPARIYRTVAKLKAEIVRSAEPIAFDQLDRGIPPLARRLVGQDLRLRLVAHHGRGSGRRRDPVVMLGIHGEGLVYSPDGEIIDSVSTVFRRATCRTAAASTVPCATSI